MGARPSRVEHAENDQAFTNQKVDHFVISHSEKDPQNHKSKPEKLVELTPVVPFKAHDSDKVEDSITLKTKSDSKPEMPVPLSRPTSGQRGKDRGTGPIKKFVPHLSETVMCEVTASPLCINPHFEDRSSFVKPGDWILAENVLEDITGPVALSGPFYVRAGARKENVFRADEVKACIVTSGGLCPGINTVLREIVNTLFFTYGVTEIYGMPFGYKSFADEELTPIALSPSEVSPIHRAGGSILGYAQDEVDAETIVDYLVQRNFTQVYLIGGMDSHKGLLEVYLEIKKRKLKISTCGVPKSIDNDIPIFDQSFGFDTAVEESQRAIKSGHVEAIGYPNGISYVKLMGKETGALAMLASLAARDVTVCLIPEIKFSLDKLFRHLHDRLKTKGNAVVVLSEGAGRDLVKEGEDIGQFLKAKTLEYFKKLNIEVYTKYIDPTYMIRSVPANASDSVFCATLGQNIVHGAMAGYTGFASGKLNQRNVYVPLDDLVAQPRRLVKPHGRLWNRLVASTGQPDLS